MTVEPGERPGWVKLQVVRFHRFFDDKRFGPLNGLFGLVDRVFAKLTKPHYHFITDDRELCGFRLQEGQGALFFAIPDPHGGVPLPGVLKSEAEDDE